MGSVRHSLFLLSRGQFDFPSTLIGQARPYVGDRSESEGKPQPQGATRMRRSTEGRRKPVQGMKVEPAFTSCPENPRLWLSVTLRGTERASSLAQNWEAEELETSRSKTTEEGSPV